MAEVSFSEKPIGVCILASTLGRLERTKEDANSDSRYEKIVADFSAMEMVFLRAFIKSNGVTPERVIIDLAPSDVSLYGTQEGQRVLSR